MNIKDEIFEAYGEMKAEQDLLAVGYTGSERVYEPV